jgi:hypothetical protein
MPPHAKARPATWDAVGAWGKRFDYNAAGASELTRAGEKDTNTAHEGLC